MNNNKNNNKMGFTLIELLAVIVVLAIIMVIATMQVNKQIKKSKNNANDINKKMIEKAVLTCIVQENDNENCNSVSELVDNGYLEPFKDPINNVMYGDEKENFNDYYPIFIKKEDGSDKVEVEYYNPNIMSEEDAKKIRQKLYDVEVDRIIRLVNSKINSNEDFLCLPGGLSDSVNNHINELCGSPFVDNRRSYGEFTCKKIYGINDNDLNAAVWLQDNGNWVLYLRLYPEKKGKYADASGKYDNYKIYSPVVSNSGKDFMNSQINASVSQNIDEIIPSYIIDGPAWTGTTTDKSTGDIISGKLGFGVGEERDKRAQDLKKYLKEASYPIKIETLCDKLEQIKNANY